MKIAQPLVPIQSQRSVLSLNLQELREARKKATEKLDRMFIIYEMLKRVREQATDLEIPLDMTSCIN